MGLFPVQQQELFGGLLLLSENNPSGPAGPNNAAGKPLRTCQLKQCRKNSFRICQPRQCRRKLPQDLPAQTMPQKNPSGPASPDSAEENSRRTCQPKLSRRKTPQDLPAQTVPQEIPPRVFADIGKFCGVCVIMSGFGRAIGDSMGIIVYLYIYEK